MRVGIDYRFAQNSPTDGPTGVGYYIYNLVAGLANLGGAEDLILFAERGGEDKNILDSRLATQFFPFSEYKKFLPFIYSHFLVSRFLNGRKLDLFHGPANVFPLGYRGKSIITVHDLAIYKHPEWFPGGQNFAKKVLVPKSIGRADKIIAVSESTKNDLLHLFQIREDKIKVIPNGVDLVKFHPLENKSAVFEEMKQKYNLRKPYLLFLGTLEPRKNLVRLIDAFWQAGERNLELRRSFDLVIAGGKGWLYKEIFEEVKNKKMEDRVIFPGYVPEADVPKLMQAAEIFVFPSLYEGFGLPILEAQACGTPVITSSVSSLPEVGGSAAYYVDPNNTDELASAMMRLVMSDHEKQKQRQLGPQQAKKFAWSKTVSATRLLYETLIK